MFSAETWESLAENMETKGIAVEPTRSAKNLSAEAQAVLKDRFGENGDDDSAGGEPEAAVEAEAEVPGLGESKGKRKGKGKEEGPAEAGTPRRKAPSLMRATPKSRQRPRSPSPVMTSANQPMPPGTPKARGSPASPIDVEEDLPPSFSPLIVDSDGNDDDEGRPLVLAEGTCRVGQEAEKDEEVPEDPWLVFEEAKEEELFADIPPPRAKRRCLEAVFHDLMALEMPKTEEMASALDRARIAVEAGGVASFAKI